MSDKQIEARLERSLRAQVAAPRLDGGFNAAVWQRIAAQQAPAASATPAPSGSPWLWLSNLVGIAVSLGLVAYALLPRLGALSSRVELPALPTQVDALLAQNLGWGIAALVLAVSFGFTASGRRLLHSLRNF